MNSKVGKFHALFCACSMPMHDHDPLDFKNYPSEIILPLAQRWDLPVYGLVDALLFPLL